jgi:hypothetical protein
MAKHRRLSRDQKRKAKLAERARKSHERVSLAYKGNKYKKPELVKVIFRTELGIYESWIMTDRQFTDRDVEKSLEKLIFEMREGRMPPSIETGSIANADQPAEDLISWNIRRNWDDLFQTQPRPNVDKLTGVLRTILGSMETWSTPAPSSQGYLYYLEGFLKRAGASVEGISPEDELGYEEPEEDDLLALGQAWCEGEPDAGEDFRSMAEAMLRSGEGEEVADVCQSLLNDAPTQEIRAELSKLALWAHQKLRKEPD